MFAKALMALPFALALGAAAPAPVVPAEPAIAPPREGWVYRGKWLWMWPNWTLSLFEGGMNTSRINPIGPMTSPIPPSVPSNTGRSYQA